MPLVILFIILQGILLGLVIWIALYWKKAATGLNRDLVRKINEFQYAYRLLAQEEHKNKLLKAEIAHLQAKKFLTFVKHGRR